MERIISIIVPCLNEAANIRLLYSKVICIIPRYKYEFIFIDDGSVDNTLNEIKRLRENDPNVKYISFTRNFGHQTALKAGMDFAKGDAILMMDADLQHPPECIPELISFWEQGVDIVNTERINSQSQGFYKSISSRSFYKIVNLLSDIRVHEHSADFRLIDKRVVEVLKKIREPEIFLRGYVSWTGFRTSFVKYTAPARVLGQSNYSQWKMFSLALSGITSFSIKPLRLSILLGICVSLFSVLYILFTGIEFFFIKKPVSGYTSIIMSIFFFGGVQLVVLGIIGEYIGRIFLQTKNRPDYLIAEILLD